MITVGMRDDSAIDGNPWINVYVRHRAINTLAGELQ
jgi:hypothetical protein